MLLVTSSVLQTGQIWESVCELMNRGGLIHTGSDKNLVMSMRLGSDSVCTCSCTYVRPT